MHVLAGNDVKLRLRVCTLVYDGAAQVFPAAFSISSFILQSLSFCNFGAFFTATFAASAYAMEQHHSNWHLPDINCIIRTVSSSAMLWYVSARIDKDNRDIFQLQQIFFIEMRHMRAMLQDLLPNVLLRDNFYDKLVHQNIAASAQANLPLDVMHPSKIVRISEICPREERQAVVLVFDMGGFTELCRQEGNVVLANIMHELFSSFDAAVRTVDGLFKMDTIGDAYIAAHMLSTDPSEIRDTYYKMLWLSGVMLSTINDVKDQRSKNVQCRIGIASGLVVAGALGWLQPRFHLRGPAMHVAEELEETALLGTVHVPCCFLRALQPSHPPVSRGDERMRCCM